MTKKVTTLRNKRKHFAPAPKKKLTKEERRAKYTKIAHDRRNKKVERERARHLTCFKCRQVGHLASSCPESTSSESNNKICYKCGSTEHALMKCPKVKKGERVVEMDLPFATCFVCQEKGHLASQCRQNERGIYVNGGSCRTCGSTKHRATDCPEKNKSSKSSASNEPTEEEETKANEALLHGQGDEQPERQDDKKQAPKKKRRVVKF